MEKDKPDATPTPGLSLSNGVFVPPGTGAQPFEEAIRPFLFDGDINDPLAAYEEFVVDGKIYRVDSAKWATRDKSIWVDDGPYAVRYIPPGTVLPPRPVLNALPAYTTNSTVTISGTRSPGQPIAVYRDWELATSIGPDIREEWQTQITVSAEGEYTFAARAIDPVSGVPSLASLPVSTFFDLANPFPPVINRPNGPMVVGESLVVEGLTGKPGSRVTLRFNGQVTEALASTEGAGSFSYDFGPLQNPGEFTLEASTTAPSGRQGPPTTVAVVVDMPQ